MKKYYYKIEAAIVQENEEKIISEQVRNPDLYMCRFEAFDSFEVFFNKYLDLFIADYYPIETYLKLYFIEESDDYDYDDGLKIDVKHEARYLLYTIYKGEIIKDQKGLEFEKKCMIDKKVINEKFSESDITDYTDETAVIHNIEDYFRGYDVDRRELIADTDIAKSKSKDLSRKTRFQMVECVRCGKKMEIKNEIAQFLMDKKNIYRDAGISCDTCEKTYYSNPMYSFKLVKVYDKNGKSVINHVPDLC